MQYFTLTSGLLEHRLEELVLQIVRHVHSGAHAPFWGVQKGDFNPGVTCHSHRGQHGAAGTRTSKLSLGPQPSSRVVSFRCPAELRTNHGTGIFSLRRADTMLILARLHGVGDFFHSHGHLRHTMLEESTQKLPVSRAALAHTTVDIPSRQSTAPLSLRLACHWQQRCTKTLDYLAGETGTHQLLKAPRLKTSGRQRCVWACLCNFEQPEAPKGLLGHPIPRAAVPQAPQPQLRL